MMKRKLEILSAIAAFAFFAGVDGVSQAKASATGAATANPAPAAQSAATPPPARPARVRAKLDGFDVSPKSAKAPNQVGGASRGLEGTPTLYAPQAAKAFTTRPTFYWSSLDDSQKMDFRLTNAAGDTVYETTLTGSQLAYPADAPQLAPGTTYFWTVQPAANLMGPPAKPVAIQIVGGGDRAAVESALASDSASTLAGEVARAQVFVDQRLWYDAIAAYTALIDKHPEDASLRAARAKVYDQVPATQPLADADMEASHAP